MDFANDVRCLEILEGLHTELITTRLDAGSTENHHLPLLDIDAAENAAPCGNTDDARISEFVLRRSAGFRFSEGGRIICWGGVSPGSRVGGYTGWGGFGRG